MPRLRLSAAARRDLELIQTDGAAKFGVAASREHMARFATLFALLHEQPFAGPARPDYGPGIRLLVNPPHRLLYRLDGDTVVIARVLHSSRHTHRAMRAR